MTINVSGPEDIHLLQDTDLPKQTGAYQLDLSDSMYDYTHKGTLDGVPVDETARQLFVRNEVQLRAALVLNHCTKLFFKKLHADDEPAYQEYLDIYDRQSRGSVVILQEQKQLLPQSSDMLIFVKYQELGYTLNPRYDYLKYKPQDEI